MRFRVLILAACCSLLLVGQSEAAPTDIEVGETRAIQGKSGTRLLDSPRPLGRLVVSLPYGTRVKVESIRESWLEVTATLDQNRAVRGWLKASQTVQPYALTQGGQFGRRGSPLARANARAARGKGFGRQDVAAAGRQLSASSEQRHKQASPAKLQQAYALLDRIETEKPTPETVRNFVAEGRLGRPDQGRRVAGQAGRSVQPRPAPPSATTTPARPQPAQER